MKEKLQEYALLAEIIGGIAIVASLLFVGFQIQQNNSIIKAGSYQNFTESLNDWRSGIYEDPYLRRIFFEFYASDEAGTPTREEQRSLNLLLGNYFSLAESAYYSREYGLLGNSEWERIKFGICQNYEDSKSKSLSLRFISEEFRDYMQSNC